MKSQRISRLLSYRAFWAFVAACVSTGAGAATVDLADAPIGATIIVPANLTLALSVEFPTGDSDAYYSVSTYDVTHSYSGYFSPNLCYDYIPNLTGQPLTPPLATGYFTPTAAAATHVCDKKWSGNFLNWTLTQTIDPFRQALTGGFRIIDTPTISVLQKAFADPQAGTSNQYVKQLNGNALVKGATPFNWNNFYTSNLHTGLNFVFSGTLGNVSGFPTGGVGFELVTPSLALTNVTYQAQGAVQVCTSIDHTDARCRQYGSNYKPVGLMQKYAAESTTQTDSIRYSAFGYLNDFTYDDTDQKIDGGVMRAKMKSVGPYAANPGTAPAVNAAAEWSATDGTFVANPNAADALASGVSNSGVVNYLNKFGLSGHYKVYDSVGELYYAATRYYRNLGNVASYSTNPATANGSATNDNFPVITAWDDPVKYSCAKNYIIGIGDIHTWNDANVPGNTIRGNQEPTKPPEVVADTALDARTATNYIANLEHIAGLTGGGSNDYVVATGLGDALIGSIGSPSGGWGASQNSFYMAGVAYDAHTRDQRTDITHSNSTDPNVIKKPPITISTFWLDVMEGNDYHEKNQFWMTAKYGGFDTSNTTAFPGGYGEYTQTAALPLNTWNSSGSYKDDRNNLAPEQYYQAANPDAMTAGLSAAFAKIRANVPTGNSTSLGLGSNNITNTGNANYAATFNSDWSGDVAGSLLAVVNVAGVITTTLTPVFHARDWLPNTAPPVTGVTEQLPTNRVIATSSSVGAGNGIPFEATSLTPAQMATLGATSTIQTKVVNYVRGDQTNESATGFRPRSYTLGDITNSKPAVVAAPSQPYADAPLNPGYSAFVAAHSTRSPVVYVGANDGMLHAFDGSMTSGSGGKELFGYVPSFLFNTNTDPNGNAIGLASVVVNPLQHHFLVDATPVAIDMDFARTRASGPAPGPTVLPDWHTVVISGLGKGGNGYFAIDVTNPPGASETSFAHSVLWETGGSRSDGPQHMGNSYGTPLVIKTAKYGWTIVLTSGYNNDNGRGYIYLVSPKDGSVYETIDTGAGSSAVQAGLAFASAYINDFTDYTADAIYAGDLLGNVWRVDLTSPTATLTAQKFAQLTDSAGNAQPVTTRPVIQSDPSGPPQTRYVFIGTGRLLADSDLVSSRQQSFYAIQDGTAAVLGTIGTPVARANLVNNTNLLAGVTLGASKGFYVDLNTYPAAAGVQAAADRINVQLDATDGIVAFAANLVGQDACSSGSSTLYALSYNAGTGFGASVLTNSAGAQIASVSNPSGGVSNGVNIVNLNGQAYLGSGFLNGSTQFFSLKHINPQFQRLNWREVPSVN